MDRRRSDDTPSLGRNLYGTPMLIGEIEIDVSGMLGDADVDRVLGSIKLRPRFQQIECGTDFRRARGLPGRLVIATPQPCPKPLAADRPRFSVAVDHDVGKGGAGGGVKQIITRPNVGEHVGGRQAGARVSTPSASGFELRSAVAACAVGSGAICPSSMRVSFHSLWAIWSGSMPVVCHQARSSRARWTAR